MEVNKNNIVNILVNESGKVLLDDKPTKLKDIKSIAEKKITQNDKKSTINHYAFFELYSIFK